MRTKTCAILVVLAQAGIASAQWGVSYHASTAEEGIQRGHADVIRSAGAANLMNSAAAINYQEAAKGYIDNRMSATNAYFQMRSVNKQAREAESGPRPSENDLVRYAQQRAPKRLSNSQLDPLTGAIQWPSLLQDEAFAKETEKIDMIYDDRAKMGHMSAEDSMEIQKITESLSAQLKSKIRDLPPQVYTEAQAFLKQLSAESYYQPS